MSGNIAKLHGTERIVYGHLRPMFPQLSDDILKASLLHPSNRDGAFDEFILLERCIDDLLVLRTHLGAAVEPEAVKNDTPVFETPAARPPGPKPAQNPTSSPLISEQVQHMPAGPAGPSNAPQHTRTESTSQPVPKHTPVPAAGLLGAQASGHNSAIGLSPKRQTSCTLEQRSSKQDPLAPVAGPTSGIHQSPSRCTINMQQHGQAVNEGMSAPAKKQERHRFPSQGSGHGCPIRAKVGLQHSVSHESLLDQPGTSRAFQTPEPASRLGADGQAGNSNNTERFPAVGGGGARPKQQKIPTVQSLYCKTKAALGAEQKKVSNMDFYRTVYDHDVSNNHLPDLVTNERGHDSRNDLQKSPKLGCAAGNKPEGLSLPALSPKTTSMFNRPQQGKNSTPKRGYDQLLDDSRPGPSQPRKKGPEAGPVQYVSKQDEDCFAVYFEEAHRSVHLIDSSQDSVASTDDSRLDDSDLPEMRKAPRLEPRASAIINEKPRANEHQSKNPAANAAPVLTAPTASSSSVASTPEHPDVLRTSVPKANAQTDQLKAHVVQPVPEMMATPVVQPVPETMAIPIVVEPAPIPRVKTAEEILDEQTLDICSLFPKSDPGFVKQQLKFAVHEDRVTVVCNYLLENPNHPKIAPAKPPDVPRSTEGATAGFSSPGITSESPMPGASKMPAIDYYKDFAGPSDDKYRHQALELLKYEFTKVPLGNLRNIMRWYQQHYAPTRRILIEAFKNEQIQLQESLETVFTNEQQKKVLISSMSWVAGKQINIIREDRLSSVTLKALKCGRQKVRLGFVPVAELSNELDYIARCSRQELEQLDEKVAQEMNENEYQAEGQSIECGCCFGDCTFDTMVQCYEGHLFCQTCLNAYVKEAVFGQGKSKLGCLSDGCEASFPKGELLKACPSSMIDKFEEKQQEQSINMANMEDLVRCPNCDFAALLDASVKVFKCQQCSKETCRHCKEDWEEHFGIPCSELEKKDETKLRLKFEERMTEAKIRFCHKCKAGFTKIDGCNKMTCPCGGKMCYICRMPDINYNHFCNHARDPGKTCTKCTACSLWTNPEEDDERAVKEIRKEANQARQAEGYSEDRMIGAPDEEPKAKKARVQ